MRLTKKEFEEWGKKNNYDDETMRLLERIRNQEPVRRVSSGPNSVSGVFPSRKMGFGIQYESYKNELAFIYEMEHDPDVLEIYDQPCEIILKYLSKKNNLVTVRHTPDFLVIRRNGAVLVECKTENKLIDLLVKMPNRFKLDEEDNWVCPPGIEYAEQFGFDYVVHSDKKINWTFQRNIEFLDDYYRNEEYDIESKVAKEIIQIVKSTPAITLEALLNRISKLDSASTDDIFNLIVHQSLFFDIHKHLLTEPKTVLIFSDAEVASAYSNLMPGSNLPKGELYKPNLINLAVNSEIIWNGNAWKIVNVGENISLINENKDVIDLEPQHFDLFVKEGKISGLPSKKNEDDAGYEILSSADKKMLETARYRYDILRKFESNEISDDELPVSRKTLNRWQELFLQAQLEYGKGFLGLIPKRRSGNTHSTINSVAKELLEKFIVDEYETITSKNKSTVYRAYELACKKQSIKPPVSYVTFCKYVNTRSKYIQTLKRKGRKAAYKYEKFVFRLEHNTPRHGERPFQIAHIDHTELDIELIDSVTGKNLGRPYLTFLIDAYSRKILALYLSFHAPSKVSCMMTLRECVKRHGRLPQILVFDGGKEFSSVYFESLLCAYEITRRVRPPAKGKYGSLVERLFGTSNTEFIHNLQGNTQHTKIVRELTKQTNPKNNAVWTFGQLYLRLSEWAYEVYDKTEHSSLGETPQEAFARGILHFGERKNTYIAYDKVFKLMTLPHVIGVKRKVIDGRGIKVNNFQYWTEEFASVGVAGSKFEIKFDPFDISIVYAYVNGRWRECITSSSHLFSGRSSWEVRIATNELKRKVGCKTVSNRLLGDFMNSVAGDELLLLQRRKDAEQKAAIDAIKIRNLPLNINYQSNKVVESSDSAEQSETIDNNVVQFPKPKKEDQSDTDVATTEESLEKYENFEGFPLL